MLYIEGQFLQELLHLFRCRLVFRVIFLYFYLGTQQKIVNLPHSEILLLLEFLLLCLLHFFLISYFKMPFHENGFLKQNNHILMFQKLYHRLKILLSFQFLLSLLFSLIFVLSFPFQILIDRFPHLF